MVLRANPATLRVMQVAETVADGCAALAKGFRGVGSRAQADQLIRASASIMSNIAEGCGRGTIPDFRRFILQARGSAQETFARLRLIKPSDDQQTRAVALVQSRTILVLKMLTRLYEHPPPDK